MNISVRLKDGRQLDFETNMEAHDHDIGAFHEEILRALTAAGVTSPQQIDVTIHYIAAGTFRPVRAATSRKGR